MDVVPACSNSLRLGNDRQATEFLARLDNEPGFGDIVDCTSSTIILLTSWLHFADGQSLDFENEQVEMSKANPTVDLTPDLWARMPLSPNHVTKIY